MPLHRWRTVLQFSDGSAESLSNRLWAVDNAPGWARSYLTLPNNVEASE
jgi:hypothetical protein